MICVFACVDRNNILHWMGGVTSDLAASLLFSLTVLFVPSLLLITCFVSCIDGNKWLGLFWAANRKHLGDKGAWGPLDSLVVSLQAGKRSCQQNGKHKDSQKRANRKSVRLCQKCKIGLSCQCSLISPLSSLRSLTSKAIGRKISKKLKLPQEKEVHTST